MVSNNKYVLILMRPPVRLGVGPQLLLPVLSSVVNGVQQLEPVVHNHRLLH